MSDSTARSIPTVRLGRAERAFGRTRSYGDSSSTATLVTETQLGWKTFRFSNGFPSVRVDISPLKRPRPASGPTTTGITGQASTYRLGKRRWYLEALAPSA